MCSVAIPQCTAVCVRVCGCFSGEARQEEQLKLAYHKSIRPERGQRSPNSLREWSSAFQIFLVLSEPSSSATHQEGLSKHLACTAPFSSIFGVGIRCGYCGSSIRAGKQEVLSASP